MIDVLKMIKREMNRKHMTAATLSRKLGAHNSTITGMLNRNTIQVSKLAELSQLFQYNFFSEIAAGLNLEEPKYDQESKQREDELKAEISQLKEQNKELKIKVEVLEGVIGRLR